MMGRYDGEDYERVPSCRPREHQFRMNGDCHVCHRSRDGLVHEALTTLAVLDPMSACHIIEFRDDGWTVMHPVQERVDGSLFDCGMRWYDEDPGVRGRYVLIGMTEFGEQVR